MIKLCWHCWHYLQDTRRKIKPSFHNKCKLEDPYVSNDHVKYIVIERCCKCGKEKESPIFRDYDIRRALAYPEYNKEGGV
jgi:hypothetical protein